MDNEIYPQYIKAVAVDMFGNERDVEVIKNGVGDYWMPPTYKGETLKFNPSDVKEVNSNE